MNKKISAPVAIIIILACTILVGGLVIWQYFGATKDSEVEYLYPVRWVQEEEMIVFNKNKDYEINKKALKEMGFTDDLILIKGYEEREERIIHNCEEYFLAIKEGFDHGGFSYERAYEGWFSEYCTIPKYLSTAISSDESYINDFVLDKNSFKDLPATVEPIVGMGDKLKAEGLTWSIYNESIKATEKNSDFRIKLEDDITYYNLSIIGRGDFNQDGIEDLFIKVGFGVKGGTLSGAEYSILTRLGLNEPIINLGEVDLKEIIIKHQKDETAEQLDDYEEISSLLNSENDPNLLIKIWGQEDNFIVGGIGSTDFELCDIWIAKKINGGWKIISRHQTSPSCGLLDQYQVPISMDPICTTEEGQEVERQEVERIEQKTTNWSIYRNEDYGFEFEHPKDWGNIVFKAQESNEVYSFTSQNKRITGIWYHEPSGILAFLLKGKKYCLPSVEENYQDILKIIHPNKEIKTIYTISSELAKYYGSISRAINFPLDGEYIVFAMGAWEWCESFLWNTTTAKLITLLEDYNIWFCDVFGPIYWSSDNKTLVIRSYTNFFAGEGTEAIFVSDYGDPEKLNKVFTLTDEEVIEDDLYFDDLYFTDNDRFSFSVFSEKYNKEKLEYYREKITTYEYNVKTKELKEIK